MTNMLPQKIKTVRKLNYHDLSVPVINMKLSKNKSKKKAKKAKKAAEASEGLENNAIKTELKAFC